MSEIELKFTKKLKVPSAFSQDASRCPVDFQRTTPL